jgi:FkbM family methyltransferase
MKAKTFARKVHTLFTTDPRWFYHYYKKYGSQNFLFWLDKQRGRDYWDATISGVNLRFHFHTPYHRSYARSAHDNGIEPHLIEPWVKAARVAHVIYDIGGFNGIYGLLAAKANPAAKVVIFEPDEINAAHIRENIRINNLRNCELLVAPVSEKVQTVRFSQGGATGEHIGETGEEMKTVSLAELPPAELLKIDAEGFEVGILRSLRGKKKGVILLELHPLFLGRAGDTAEDFYKEIKLGEWRYWPLGDRSDQQHFLLF